MKEVVKELDDRFGELVEELKKEIKKEYGIDIDKLED